jgi:M6 family metalloprotease-like protein
MAMTGRLWTMFIAAVLPALLSCVVLVPPVSAQPGGVTDPSPGGGVLTTDPDAIAGPGLGVVTNATALVGSMSVVAPPEAAPVENQPGVWSIIPGLSTNVYSRAGDDLEITISAEMISTGQVQVRALVDLVPAEPSSVIFKSGSQNFDGARSFTFVIRNVKAGPHMVEMLWFTPFGTKARVGDRTLSVNSAASSSGEARLSVRAGDPAIHEMITTVDGWSDIPNLATTFRTDKAGTAVVTFSADAHADRGRFWARAIVDGTVLSDVVFAEAGNGGRRGARSHSFVLPNLRPGSHSARVQWRADRGGEIRMGERTMSVYVAPASTDGGGLVATGQQLAPTVIGSTWIDVPAMSALFTTTAPSSSVSVSFGGEVLIPSKRLFIRAIVNGATARPHDTVLIQGGPKWRATSYTFTVKNLAPGAHRVRIQAMADPGAQARIGDRFLKVVHKRRSGAEFSQLYERLQPTTGIFASLVICFDPKRPGHTPPSFAYLKGMMEGSDGGMSTRAWFREVTHNRVLAGDFTYNGCGDGAWHPAPAGRQGNWYWDNDAFPTMWADAIKAADKTFDFHAFDRNRDNRLTAEELTVIIVRPQKNPDGFNRSVSVSVDGRSTPLQFTVVEVYLSPEMTRVEADKVSNIRRWNVGLLSHELSHYALNAWDLHSCPSNTAPGHASIMDAHSVSSHLDPFHKLKLGHLTADLVELTPLNAREATLRPVETEAEVVLLYNPRNNDGEYFVVENRWPGTQSRPNYDMGLSDGTLAESSLPPAGAVLVWHLFQDFALAQQFKPKGGESCDRGRNSVRKIKALKNPGETIALKWANGDMTGAEIALVDRANPQAARIAIRPAVFRGEEIRTGAGLCLDVHAPEFDTNGGRVQAWACNGMPQQRWTFDRSSGAIRISSGLCLDVHAPDMAVNGGRVQVWACNGQQQQQWTPQADGTLRNGGGLCLDVHAPDQSTNGARVQVWQCNGQTQQRFASPAF